MQQLSDFINAAAPAINCILMLIFGILWLLERFKRKFIERLNADNIKKANADKKDFINEIERLKKVAVDRQREIDLAERQIQGMIKTQDRAIERAHQCRKRRFNNIPFNASFSSTYALDTETKIKA